MKIKFNFADLIVLVFALIFLIVFGRLALGAEFPSQDRLDWRTDMAQEISAAYQTYQTEIKFNPTDRGCLEAELKFDDSINLILFNFRDFIKEEEKYGWEELEKARK